MFNEFGQNLEELRQNSDGLQTKIQTEIQTKFRNEDHLQYRYIQTCSKTSKFIISSALELCCSLMLQGAPQIISCIPAQITLISFCLKGQGQQYQDSHLLMALPSKFLEVKSRPNSTLAESQSVSPILSAGHNTPVHHRRCIAL